MSATNADAQKRAGQVRKTSQTLVYNPGKLLIAIDHGGSSSLNSRATLHARTHRATTQTKMDELKLKERHTEPGTVQTQSGSKSWLPPNGNEFELRSLAVCARRGVAMGNAVTRRHWPPLPCSHRCCGGPVTIPTATEAPSPPRSPSSW
jgi:hypothetical protein